MKCKNIKGEKAVNYIEELLKKCYDHKKFIKNNYYKRDIGVIELKLKLADLKYYISLFDDLADSIHFSDLIGKDLIVDYIMQEEKELKEFYAEYNHIINNII